MTVGKLRKEKKMRKRERRRKKMNYDSESKGEM